MTAMLLLPSNSNYIDENGFRSNNCRLILAIES